MAVPGAENQNRRSKSQNQSHHTYLFVEAIDYPSTEPMHAQSPPKPYATRASTQNRSGAEAQQDLIGAHVDTTAAAACSLGGWDGALFRRKRRKQTKSPEQQLGQKIENVPSRATSCLQTLSGRLVPSLLLAPARLTAGHVRQKTPQGCPHRPYLPLSPARTLKTSTKTEKFNNKLTAAPLRPYEGIQTPAVLGCSNTWKTRESRCPYLTFPCQHHPAKRNPGPKAPPNSISQHDAKKALL